MNASPDIESILNPQSPPLPNPMDQQRKRLASRIAAFTSTILGIATLIFTFTVFSQPSWQLIVIAASCAAAYLVSLFVLTNQLSSDYSLQSMMLGIVVQSLLVIFAMVFSNVSLMIAAICFIFGIIIATGTLADQKLDLSVSLSYAFSILAAFIGSFSPFQQISLPIIEIYAPAILGLLVILYLVLLSMEYVVNNLRIKLVTGSLAIAIIPLIFLSIIETRFIITALQNQKNQSLMLAAEQVATQVDNFIESNRDAIEKEAKLPVFINYLEMAPDSRPDSQQERDLQVVLGSLQTKEQAYLRSYAILNLKGNNIYDTNPVDIGKNEGLTDYFIQTVQTGQTYVSPILFSPENGNAYVYFASPIRSQRQQIIGVIRMKYDALIFQNILSKYNNLVGLRSHPILIDENDMRVADTLTPNRIFSFLVPLTSNEFESLKRVNRLPDYSSFQISTNLPKISKSLENYLVTPYFTTDVNPNTNNLLENGAITSLKSKSWFILFVQEQTALLALLQDQYRLSTLIATLFAAVIGVIATIAARFFSTPIVRLQRTAEKISSGDIQAQAQVESNDEIGKLANAFNSMTGQLRNFINELEDRVRERTKELAAQNDALVYRSRQLQTVSDVARSIVSTQGLEALLTQVTSMISERFGFYHVGIFLLDSKGEFAVLRAANSEGGQRMLARQHKLKVGQVGIVGYATGRGEARIATDVGQDAVYFNNPDLPLTRSEMALPLKANNQVIGALDVQSTVSNVFTQEDIELFSTLADQIAIAILNNQLLTNTMAALEEAQRVHRQYLRQEWATTTKEKPFKGFVYTPRGIVETDDSINPILATVFDTGQVIASAAANDNPAILAVPIMLRGETIGVIHLQDATLADRLWTNDEVNAIRAVSDQVGLALENARLLDNTIRRAERERKVLDITGKIRATNDPQSMIEIAVAELQRALSATRVQILLKKSLSDDDENSNGNHGNHGQSFTQQ